MPSVLLPGISGRDPLGEQALLAAFRSELAGHDLMPSPANPLRAIISRAGRRADAVVLAGCDAFAGAALSTAATAALTSSAEGSVVSSLTRPRRPLALVGVSAGVPTRATERWAARRLIRRADLVLFSDEESASRLAAAGVPAPMRVAADPAWLAVVPAASGSVSTRSVIVALDAGVDRAVEAELFRGLNQLARHGARIDLLPWAGSKSPDEVMAERFALELRRTGARAEVVPPPADLASAAGAMSESGAVLALRYRAVHAAAGAGVPVVGIAVDSRIPALARRLDQVCLPSVSFGGSIAPAVMRASVSAAPSPSTVKEEVARAEAGLALLRVVLQRGDVDSSDLEGLPLAPDPWL